MGEAFRQRSRPVMRSEIDNQRAASRPGASTRAASASTAARILGMVEDHVQQGDRIERAASANGRRYMSAEPHGAVVQMQAARWPNRARASASMDRLASIADPFGAQAAPAIRAAGRCRRRCRASGRSRCWRQEFGQQGVPRRPLGSQIERPHLVPVRASAAEARPRRTRGPFRQHARGVPAVGGEKRVLAVGQAAPGTRGRGLPDRPRWAAAEPATRCAPSRTRRQQTRLAQQPQVARKPWLRLMQDFGQKSVTQKAATRHQVRGGEALSARRQPRRRREKQLIHGLLGVA